MYLRGFSHDWSLHWNAMMHLCLFGRQLRNQSSNGQIDMFLKKNTRRHFIEYILNSGRHCHWRLLMKDHLKMSFQVGSLGNWVTLTCNDLCFYNSWIILLFYFLWYIQAYVYFLLWRFTYIYRGKLRPGSSAWDHPTSPWQSRNKKVNLLHARLDYLINRHSGCISSSFIYLVYF